MNYIYSEVSFNEMLRFKPSFEASFKLLKKSSKGNTHCVYDDTKTNYLKKIL